MARQERLAYYKGMLDTSTQRKGGAANAKAGAGAGRASGLSQVGPSGGGPAKSKLSGGKSSAGGHQASNMGLLHAADDQEPEKKFKGVTNSALNQYLIYNGLNKETIKDNNEKINELIARA